MGPLKVGQCQIWVNQLASSLTTDKLDRWPVSVFSIDDIMLVYGCLADLKVAMHSLKESRVGHGQR